MNASGSAQFTSTMRTVHFDAWTQLLFNACISTINIILQRFVYENLIGRELMTLTRALYLR